MRGLQVPETGVLALQGAFAAHAAALAELGVATREVRTPADLASVDSLVIPGGESSTLSGLLVSSGLLDPLRLRLAESMPVFGTCAGLIVLASRIADGRPDQVALGAIDVAVRRNAFGRQRDSFEAEVDTVWGPVHGIFIRAPRIESVGAGVSVLGTLDGEPVLVATKNAMACTFHPELGRDDSVHRHFVEMVDAWRATDGLRASRARTDTGRR